MEGFLDHVEAAYASTSDGFFAHTEDIHLSAADPDHRRISGVWGYGSPHDSEPFVVNARPVGGRNAGAFQGWVTLSQSEWRRIVSPRPSGWHSYTMMIGFAPDDETIWWSAVYDDDLLAKIEPMEMDGGRWVRIPPETAKAAEVAHSNMLQQTLELLPEPEPEPPSVREVIIDNMHAGISLILDDEEMKHLSDSQLAVLQNRLLSAHTNVNKWREVRRSQSYSRQKARAK